jgi:hypothetical protein
MDILQVFGDSGTRLMCWPHVYRNVVPRLVHIKKDNPDVYNELLNDIEELQWSANNEVTFRLAYDLLEAKYKTKYKDHLKVLEEFFMYFRRQWIDSPVFR